MNTSIDWNTYQNTFPDRYLQQGDFDHAVYNLIRIHPYNNIQGLDLGGGTTGTKCLQNPKVEAFSLDPNITPPPWQTPITWETQKTFDLIVARGSINYLTTEELRRIPALLKPKGIFAFNTFATPQEINRPFKNSQSGREGNEATVLENNEGQITVHHTLQFHDGETITHSFFYHPESLLRKIFQDGQLTIIPLKKNSLLCFFQTPE